MGLKDTMQADLQLLVADTAATQSESVTITDPGGNSGSVVGILNSISTAIDPDSGVQVRGDFVSLFVTLGALTAEGITETPAGYTDTTDRWTVTDADGNEYLIKFSAPDYVAQGVLLTLEALSE